MVCTHCGIIGAPSRGPNWREFGAFATNGWVWVIHEEHCALAQHFHAQRWRFRFPSFDLLAEHGPLALGRLVLPLAHYLVRLSRI